MSGRFGSHGDDFHVGQRVEVMVSTDPPRFWSGVVTAVDGSVKVHSDDGTELWCRYYEVRPLDADDTPGWDVLGQLDLFGGAL